MIVAGALHFYLSRRGGGEGGSTGAGLHSRENSIDDITIISRASSNGMDGGNFGRSPLNENHAVDSFFLKVTDVAHKIVTFPSFLVSSIRTPIVTIVAIPAYMSEKCTSGLEWSYGKLLHGAVIVLNIPAQLESSTMALAYSASLGLNQTVSTV